MLIRIAYCDDEKANGDRIKKFIEQIAMQINQDIELDFYLYGSILLEKIEMEPDCYDMFLLDMEMPEINGIELAEKIREISSTDVIITFLTSYPKYMQQSFGVQAFQYLLKPISYDGLKKEIVRTIDYINKDDKSILVTDYDTGYETLMRLKNIVAIEKQKGNAVMEVMMHEKSVLVKGNFTDYETMLVENNFIRVSRNCMINMRYVHGFFERDIAMTNGKRVEMSRRKVTEVKEQVTRFLVLGGK